MSERRFTEKPDLNPEAVRSLPDGHPALVENRTLFPSTVVTVTADAPDRLLVSGENNIKIGKTVEKGEFNGYGIYMLSLEERATCPDDCAVRSYCYGNGMQMARRHRIGDPDVFFDRLGLEIAELLDDHEGLLIRLHVLGDFPSVEYVSFWKDVLEEHDNVVCFGYTHRRTIAWGGDEIGDAIQSVKDAHGKRFRIRWSTDIEREDSARVIDYLPQKPHTSDGALVCPSQTDATACCATCALCWETNGNSIAFIKHGPKSSELEAQAVMADGRADEFESELLRAMPAMRRYALSLTHNASAADDLAQTVAEKAVKHRDRFALGTNMGAWLSTIARNEFLSGKRKKREVEDPEGVFAAHETSNDDTFAIVDARQQLAVVDLLPEDQKSALLDIASGVTYEEAADQRGIAVGTVKSRVSRARSALAEMIEDGVRNDHEEPQIDQRETIVRAAPSLGKDHRRIRPIKLSSKLIPKNPAGIPQVRIVDPATLIVEESYQRGLSGKSLRLIKKIVEEWDWARFKPPVCAQVQEGLFVIDGQHTAIAAASHPGIKAIPVMVVVRPDIEDRAAAFVSQNMNRVAMSPLQIFHAQLVAGDKDALGILRCVVKAGASVPRSPPQKGKAKPGEIVSVGALRRVYDPQAPEHLERVLRIAVLSGKAPIDSLLIRGISLALKDETPWMDDEPDMILKNIGDEEIAWQLSQVDLPAQALEVAQGSECNVYDALASLITCGVWEEGEKYEEARNAVAA